MSDTISSTNTPIFDQLARERGYDSLVSGGATLRLRDNQPVSPWAHLLPGGWIAKQLPQMSPSTTRGRNAKLTVNFHPLDVKTMTLEEFVGARKQEFNRKHPNAVDVVMTSVEEFDGTYTLNIEGYENTGVTLAKKPVWGRKSSPASNILVLSPLTTYRGVKPKPVTGIFKAVAGDDEKQTDEIVNAASTDAPHHPQLRALWIMDEDDADEE